MKELIDITLTLGPDLPAWPDSGGLRLIPSMRIREGDEYNVSTLSCDLHMGTHVDAPWHCFDDGQTVDELPVDVLIGRAFVAYLPDVRLVTERDLANLDLPADVSRLLLRTDNSELWKAGVKEFHSDYVALSPAAAEWIVRRRIRLLGVDYLSVEPFDAGPSAHRVLLGANVVVLEGLNLADVQPGPYELVCLPMKLKGAEGAPVRAVLLPSAGEKVG